MINLSLATFQNKTLQKISIIYKYAIVLTHMCDHYHVIVCDKVLIISTYVCHGMENNVAEAIFKILFRNIIFHFLSAKNDFFCEAST